MDLLRSGALFPVLAITGLSGLVGVILSGVDGLGGRTTVHETAVNGRKRCKSQSCGSLLVNAYPLLALSTSHLRCRLENSILTKSLALSWF